MKHIILFFLLCVVGFCGWTMEYHIRSVDIIVDGRSKDFAIHDLLPKLQKGLVFEKEEDFLDFLQEQQQILDSARTLALSHIVYISEIVEEDLLAVDVTVYTYDTWNIIVLPYIKYDDNDGLTLSLRMRDYNLFGQQGLMKLDFDYDFTQNLEHALRMYLEIDSPLKLWDQDFSILLQQKLEYFVYKGVRNDLLAGLRYNLDLAEHRFFVGYNQQLFYSQLEEEDNNYFYGKSYPYLGVKIDTGLNVPHMGQFYYELKLAVGRYYSFDTPIVGDKQGTALELHNNFSIGEYHWLGNLRYGLQLTLENYNWYKPDAPPEIPSWDMENTLTVTTFFPFSLFAVSNRTILRYAPNTEISEPGQYLRGILDKGLFKDSGKLGVFINTDFTIVLFRVDRAVEGHMVFFFDLGIVYDHSYAFNSSKDIQYAIGIEGILFPFFARSFFIRGSFGINLTAIINNTEASGWNRFWSSREIFIGIGHHF